MPNANQAVRFIACASASYRALGVYNENTIYFCTDTQQIYLGDKEYTKSIQILESQPTGSTVGNEGRIYVYNGNLYMCQIVGYTYNWIRIANVNDNDGTVISVTAGAGLSGGNITTSGTISHAVPAGADVKSDTLNDASPSIGGSFQIAGIETDEFGHVTHVNLHTVTLPEESPLNISSSTDAEETIEPEGTFTVVTEVAKGDGSHDIEYKKKAYRLPLAENTTYTFEPGSTTGSIKITPSNGSPFEVVVKDGDQIGTGGSGISGSTNIFNFKGAVQKKSDLPSTADIGDMYYVIDENIYYIYGGSEEGWTESNLGIDLSLYALTEEVIPRVLNAEGQVPKFNNDGTLSSSGYTIAKDVPADAKFTDTVYTHPTHPEHDLGLYKIKVDDQGHVIGVVKATAEDIEALGITGSGSDTKVKTTPNTTSMLYLAGTSSNIANTGELQINPKTYLSADGAITAPTFHGKADNATNAETADFATRASQDANGNSIEDTYATKDEVADSIILWDVI